MDLFSEMARNKSLPKYQFERRVDALIALFLPDLLASTRGWKVDVVAPEFPLKSPSNSQTANVDFALYRHASPSDSAAWVLLELKTDASSVCPKQQERYLDAQSRGMKSLRADLDTVYEATLLKAKYRTLLSRIDAYPMDAPIELLYLLPAYAQHQIRSDRIGVVTFADLQDLDSDRYAEAWAAFKEHLLPALL